MNVKFVCVNKYIVVIFISYVVVNIILVKRTRIFI